MQTHLRIVRQLADGELHSGEALAEQLGISRAAVWKAVRKAGAELGLGVESVRGRGYRLTSPLELLDPERILAAISHQGKRRIARLEVYDDIDSTNSHLMRLGRAGAPAGTLCLAERQTAGRGRHGRSWISPFGNNVYLSALWRYPFGPEGLGGLSLAAGTAVARALQAEGVEDIALKWPNDVLWQRRKLAGLLLEVAGETQGPSRVVVGVGVNTRLSADEVERIDQPCVDLETVLGERNSGRNWLAARLADCLIEVLERYGREGLPPFIEEWERFDRLRGERVEIRLGNSRTIGIHAGITAQGALRIDDGDSIQTFQAGEVSLRPAD